MELPIALAFDPESDPKSFFESIPARPAVFALFPRAPGTTAAPYLGRTRDLRRRLARLLSPPRASSRLLNLRGLIGRIEYQIVGSPFEAQWMLYHLNREYYPTQYRERLRLKPPALLKLNLRNRFPRCYPTRRLSHDGSLYYGPFPSLVAAGRFASEFLDFFKIRRCVEELKPDPSHPGCIYSQLRMCLAPCFAGCTDREYQVEVGDVVEFLDSQGQGLLRSFEAERAQASEALEFEQAAKIHRRIEKVNEVLRQKPELVRNLRHLDGVVVQRGAEVKTVTFFPVTAGELHAPVALSLDENVPVPIPLDKQLHALLERSPTSPMPPAHARKTALPPWEHLSLLARWYYSSFREGELVMWSPGQIIPHSRLIRVCRKLLATAPTQPHSP
jgi:excinuclease UvrABC nuclease subunit